MNYKQKTLSWINKKCTLNQDKSKGLGIYAKSTINKNELVSIIGGYILNANEESKLSMDVKDYSLQISNEFVIGPQKSIDIEYSCFFNHSCEPNIGVKGQIFLMAMKKIKKGEELTFDYAMTIAKMKGAKKYKMDCLCGSKNCRKIITEDDWKNPVLQKKYKGYFQWYIQEKIDKLKKSK